MNKAVFNLCGDLEGVEVELTDVRNVFRLFIGGFERIQDTVEHHFPGRAEIFRADFEQLQSLLFMSMRSFDEALCQLRTGIDQGYNISRTSDQSGLNGQS